MTKLHSIIVGFVWIVALSACTSTGSGVGQTTKEGVSDQTVEFSWKSTDGGISGSISASLPATNFEGRFFQITSQTRSEALDPLWRHWRRGWHDWPYWGSTWPYPYPTTQFITHYSGKVVASLASESGQNMRCRFHLSEPVMGMRGGGQGECQISDGRVVRATFAGK